MPSPIYKPKGAALEYAEWGLNIYDSCPHGCTYCFARPMAKRFGKPWGSEVKPRPGLLEALNKQLSSKAWQNAGRLVHLCFTCDPYPVGHDSSMTREVIKAIKASGNHVQILTKGDETAQRDFDLLDSNDWFGVTLSGAHDLPDVYEPYAATETLRAMNLSAAHRRGISTWVSCEPVLCPEAIEPLLYYGFVDLWRIGKLNHQSSDINWRQFGHKIEALCQYFGRIYYIKNALRKEMESHDAN
jgi:DNA repair photolyase